MAADFMAMWRHTGRMTLHADDGFWLDRSCWLDNDNKRGQKYPFYEREHFNPG